MSSLQVFRWFKGGEERLSENKCKKRGIKSKARQILDFSSSPIASALGSVHFEMNGNREVIVEGCRGILQYDENIVKISVKKMSVAFFGRNLSIKCMDVDSLVITGFVTSIEFIT